MGESGSAVEAITLEANGFTFTGLAAGPAGGDLVLLLHGWPQFADSWTEVARELGEAGYRAVALDQRGYSNGARPEAQEAYKMEHLVSDDASAFAAAHRHSGNHEIDWGAIVGWHVAQWHPERLLSFTSLAIPHLHALGDAKASDPDQQKRGAYVEFFQAPGNVAEKALMGNDAAALRAVYEGKLSAAQVEKNVQRLREPGALTAVLNWYRTFDFYSKLGPVSVPTLYIWASNDRALGELHRQRLDLRGEPLDRRRNSA